jgi:hypothetical protein
MRAASSTTRGSWWTLEQHKFVVYAGVHGPSWLTAGNVVVGRCAEYRFVKTRGSAVSDDDILVHVCGTRWSTNIGKVNEVVGNGSH